MRSSVFIYEMPEQYHIRQKKFSRMQNCLWSFQHSPQMEPLHNGAVENDARTPELPPPHLLLDLDNNAPSDKRPAQNGSMKTDHDVESKVFDSQDTTCDDVSNISSTPSAIPQSKPTPRGARASANTPKEDDAVERRRRRTPSTPPRPSSGIPRLSANEPVRRSTRTASESRQRPKSEIATRTSSESTSRSTSFGWSRRPNSALHQRSSTDPTQDARITPRSRTSSTSSHQSSGGGRRMEIRSKIGSLDNAKHKPGGGNVKIFNEKKDLTNVSSKCGSFDYAGHKPGGGNVQITDEKVQFRQVASSKVGSLNNAKHKPGGGDVKIDNQKLKWEVKSKVGSLDNAKHRPGGGEKKIDTRKLNWDAKSKVRSMENASHVAGGGNKKIETAKLDFREKAASKVGSLDNARHMPGGGDKKIFSEVLPWTEPPKSSQDPSNQQIHSQPLNFKQNAHSKVGSLDNVHYHSTGGEVEIFQENLPWLKYNKPNISQEDKVRIEKKGGILETSTFDREKQKQYDYKVKGRQYPSSRASTTESYGFGGSDDGMRPKKQRHSTTDVRTSVPIVSSNNNALSPVNETKELDNNNNNKRRANDIAFTEIDKVEDARNELETDGRYANDNRRNKASKSNNSNATSSRRLNASDKYAKHTSGENSSDRGESKVRDNAAGKQAGKRESSEEQHQLSAEEPTTVMPTSSTAKSVKSKGTSQSVPSYTSTRPPHRSKEKSKSPNKLDPTLGARRGNDENPHVVFLDDDNTAPPTVDEVDPWELINETWEQQAHQKTTDVSTNKENRRPTKKDNGRGVKDLYRTEGYADRFKLMPVRPEDETPQPIRLSPLLVEPKRDVSPEWKKKAQLKIDYDKDGREMTLKTNLKPSTRLPRVAGMSEDESEVKSDSYTGQMARNHKSPRREKKPHKINSDRLENILPSINQLLDVKEPSGKVYSLYSNQSGRKEIPRRRIHRPEKLDNSEELKAIRDEFYDEFLSEAAKQFEPKPRKDPLNNADPHLNILQQNISDYHREIDENRFIDRQSHDDIDNYDDYFPTKSNENAFYISGVDDNKYNYDSDLYGGGEFFLTSHRFDQLTVEPSSLEMPRASAPDFNDQLPPLPINFGKSEPGSATTATSSISLQDQTGRFTKKRPDYLKWKPGEVPFDKRSSNRTHYSLGSPPHPRKTMKKNSEGGFANRFSMQKIWYDDYNFRMRNRHVAEKIDNHTLDRATFELVD